MLHNEVVKAERGLGFGMELNKIIRSVQINGSKNNIQNNVFSNQRMLKHENRFININ